MKHYLIQIKADGTLCKVLSKETPTLEDLQALVGGYIEVIPTRLPRPHRPMMVINEEGKNLGLPRNEIASIIGITSGIEDEVVGDAVLVLEVGEDLRAMKPQQTSHTLFFVLSHVLERGEGWIVAPMREDLTNEREP